MRSILTVTTPAAGGALAYDLTTLAAVRADLGISVSDTSQDANIAVWISAASAAIAGYCNRIFQSETVKEVFRLPFPIGYPTSSRRENLLLRRVPSASIVSLIENGTTLDPTSYELDPDVGSVRRLCNDFPVFWCWGKIEVNYIGGYTTIPKDVARACVTLVKNLYFSAASDPNIKAESVQNVSDIDYFNLDSGAESDPALSALPASVRLTLNRYRLHYL